MTGSDVTVVGASPEPGDVWAMVDDDGSIVVHLLRYVSDDVVVGRGTANDIDDQPVRRTRLIGRVTSATSSGGVTSTFGWRSRVTHRKGMQIRRMARVAFDRW